MATLVVSDLSTAVEALLADDFQVRTLTGSGNNFLGQDRGFKLQCGRAYDLDRRTDFVDLTYDWSGQVSLTSTKIAILRDLINTYHACAVQRAIREAFGAGNFDVSVEELSDRVQYRIERIYGDEMKRVEVICGKDGTIKVNAEGFHGDECTRLTDSVQRRLGATNFSEEEIKPEFYETTPAITEEQLQ